MLDESRYVYVEAGTTVLLALSRGRRGWADALADGSVAVFGNPDLIRQVPTWFRSVDESMLGGVPSANRLQPEAAGGVGLIPEVPRFAGEFLGPADRAV
jgi:hypothetical protein